MNAALPDSDSYRDARPGAEARRAQLLQKNRADLANQSLALRRIYVRRLARSWSGLAVLAGGVAVAAVSVSSSVRAILEWAIPGRLPAVASDLLLVTPIAGVLVYFVARALAEEGFTAAMTRAIRPGADVFDDVERLSVAPGAIARTMAERYRSRSIAAAIGGFAIAGPLVALVAIGFFAHGAWQSPSTIETLAWRAGPPLAQTAVASLVLAAAWLSISASRAAPIRSRARRSAAVLAGAGAALAALSFASSPGPALFLGIWTAWSGGAALGLVWASARVRAEDRIARFES